MANRSQGKRDANSAEHPLPTSSMECPFNKLATEAFLVFDEANNETVDVREVGTIIRSLGCCPSESELQHLVSAMEEDGTTQFVTLQKFVPTVSSVLQQKRFQSATEDLILRAFQTLDSERKGFLSRKELESSLTGSGEPFSSDEMEEMWTAIKALRCPSDSDRTLPPDAFEYSVYAKYMMK
ncbi:dynein regulatory complex protein 8 [Daphnia magna]|uniref:EF-hand domain-containing protein n=1 Tax=Daphnia magna TaxID=35525 RepID=A0ABQ9YN81_9CRUS|nr:dynein regulatory complex protein 8 [Daphnia magna]KAK4002070.1 hypothetical protein OUZ56_003926 [Daphnia magna]